MKDLKVRFLSYMSDKLKKVSFDQKTFLLSWVCFDQLVYSCFCRI